MQSGRFNASCCCLFYDGVAAAVLGAAEVAVVIVTTAVCPSMPQRLRRSFGICFPFRCLSDITRLTWPSTQRLPLCSAQASFGFLKLEANELFALAFNVYVVIGPRIVLPIGTIAVYAKCFFWRPGAGPFLVGPRME